MRQTRFRLRNPVVPSASPMTGDLDTLRREVQAGAVDTVVTCFPDLYGRLMGKRLDAGAYTSEVSPLRLPGL